MRHPALSKQLKKQSRNEEKEEEEEEEEEDGFDDDERLSIKQEPFVNILEGEYQGSVEPAHSSKSVTPQFKSNSLSSWLQDLSWKTTNKNTP